MSGETQSQEVNDAISSPQARSTVHGHIALYAMTHRLDSLNRTGPDTCSGSLLGCQNVAARHLVGLRLHVSVVMHSNQCSHPKKMCLFHVALLPSSCECTSARLHGLMVCWYV